MNYLTKTNLLSKLIWKNIRPRPKRGGDIGWLIDCEIAELTKLANLGQHPPNILPPLAFRADEVCAGKNFMMKRRELKEASKHNLRRYPCGCCDWIAEQKYRERKLGHELPRLLERVEKLEQAVEEIWGNCECVRKRTKVEERYSASICEGCGHSYGLCVCEPEELREHECDRECPDAPCVICGQYEGWGC